MLAQYRAKNDKCDCSHILICRSLREGLFSRQRQIFCSGKFLLPEQQQSNNPETVKKLFSTFFTITMHQTFKTALVQMSMSADKTVNLRRGAEYIEQAADAGARLVCLPELFLSPYFCQREDSALFDLAEEYPKSETISTLRAIAKKTKNEKRVMMLMSAESQ
jgi:hypothetical protein